MPEVRGSEIHFRIDNKVVILIDDVLFTGRTIRAALDELNSFGRASKVQLAVLVDRGHRELPIKADFIGKNIPTHEGEHVEVNFKKQMGKIRCNLDHRGKNKNFETEAFTFLKEYPVADLEVILDTAFKFREVLDRPIKKVPSLQGVTIVNLFFENSTRQELVLSLHKKG